MGLFGADLAPFSLGIPSVPWSSGVLSSVSRTPGREDPMTRLKKTWQPAEEGRALAAELHQVLDISHRQAKGLIDAGCVKVNGEPAHSYGLRLKAEDKIAVAYDPDTTYQTLPQPRKALD